MPAAARRSERLKFELVNQVSLDGTVSADLVAGHVALSPATIADGLSTSFLFSPEGYHQVAGFVQACFFPCLQFVMLLLEHREHADRNVCSTPSSLN